MFGGTFTARLTHEVRAKRGWSYGANSSLSYDRQRQTFSMWTFPKAEDAAPCIALELEMLEDWWKDGVSADELEWAKQYLVRSHAFDRDTTSKRVGLRLDEQLCDLPEGYYANYTDSIEAVTLEQANAAIQKRISLEDLVMVVVGTHSHHGRRSERRDRRRRLREGRAVRHARGNSSRVRAPRRARVRWFARARVRVGSQGQTSSARAGAARST